MDAFRLLSRSTKLKSSHASKLQAQNRRASTRTEVDSRSLDPLQEKLFPSKHYQSASQTRKRKRGSISVVKPQEAPDKSVSHLDTTDHLGGSISRDSPVDPNDSHSELSSLDSRRSFFRSHKVKMVSLTGDVTTAALNQDDQTKPMEADKSRGSESSNRKRTKEALRLYIEPLKHFASLTTRYGVSKTLVENILDQGYSTPTEVQLATIPALLDPVQSGMTLQPGVSKVDLLTVAPTGSGKTLAFLIPVVHHILKKRRDGQIRANHQQPTALIVAPTKELVTQTVNEGRKLCRRTGVSITAMQKGMKFDHTNLQNSDEPGEEGDSDHIPEVGNAVKADIIVTTPLILANVIERGEIDLSHVRYLVLDEADVLLDALFYDQTLSIWNACCHTSMRTSLWSATIGSNIEERLIKMLDERYIQLDLEQKVPLIRCIIGLKDSALPTISHQLRYAATEPGKLIGLRQILHPPPAFDSNTNGPPLRPPFLVFTQTIERAIALHAELVYDILVEAGGSSRIAVLHSDMSDSRRSDIMAGFRKGEIWIIITTDLLSRGIDLRGINGVVNYDIPTSTASYVHRVGRTGRAGRAGGVAVTFYTREDIKYVKSIANAIDLSEKGRSKSEGGNDEQAMEKWLLHALPDLSKQDRLELKKRGVGVRRRVREGDDVKEARAKRRARISSKSGYERRLENKRRGAIEGSRAARDAGDVDDDRESDEWAGFDE